MYKEGLPTVRDFTILATKLALFSSPIEFQQDLPESHGSIVAGAVARDEQSRSTVKGKRVAACGGKIPHFARRLASANNFG